MQAHRNRERRVHPWDPVIAWTRTAAVVPEDAGIENLEDNEKEGELYEIEYEDEH